MFSLYSNSEIVDHLMYHYLKEIKLFRIDWYYFTNRGFLYLHVFIAYKIIVVELKYIFYKTFITFWNFMCLTVYNVLPLKDFWTELHTLFLKEAIIPFYFMFLIFKSYNKFSLLYKGFFFTNLESCTLILYENTTFAFYHFFNN